MKRGNECGRCVTKVPAKMVDDPMTLSFDCGIKFLKLHIDLSLDGDYMERRLNEAVRSKRSHPESR